MIKIKFGKFPFNTHHSLYPVIKNNNYTNENVWKCVFSPSSITCVSLIRSKTLLLPPNTTSNTLLGLIANDDKEWIYLLVTLSGKCICRITIHSYVYMTSLLQKNHNTCLQNCELLY